MTSAMAEEAAVPGCPFERLCNKNVSGIARGSRAVGRMWLWAKTLYPGEHQNRWQMGGHPPQNGAICPMAHMIVHDCINRKIGCIWLRRWQLWGTKNAKQGFRGGFKSACLGTSRSTHRTGCVSVCLSGRWALWGKGTPPSLLGRIMTHGPPPPPSFFGRSMIPERGLQRCAAEILKDVAGVLDMDGIAIRAGHHCAQPLHRRNPSERKESAIF